MKYRLLKELPFMAGGVVFGKGCWSGGGWGVDRGYAKHGAHNGIVTFSEAENEILTDVINREDWAESIPERIVDLFTLLDAGIIDRDDFYRWLTFSDKS